MKMLFFNRFIKFFPITKTQVQDNIKQDICQRKIKNWWAFVQDRGIRKEFIKKGKSFQLKEVERLEEVLSNNI
jgi:hypothetical protein